MGWPSKNPDDYMEPGRWNTGPAPRWLRRYRGQPDPDPIPYRYVITAGAAGLVAGAGVQIATGPGASLMLPFIGVYAGRLVLDVVWWMTRRRRRGCDMGAGTTA